MPRTRLPPIPPDERQVTGSDEEIRRRLNDFVRKTFKTQRAFEQAAGIPHETAAKWYKKRGSLPDFENLRKCAAQGLSLDWFAPTRSAGEMIRQDSVQPMLERYSSGCSRTFVGRFTSGTSLPSRHSLA